MIAAARELLGRAPRAISCLAGFLFALLALTGVALACVGPAEPTALTTSLSGESKSGTSITVLEGSKVKDQATLEGKNAGKATGKITYSVYADPSCKELVAKAGEIEFKEGKVPASEEVTLEGGRTYYWQAHYGGDSIDAESTSSCGGEVLTVKAAVAVSTKLHSGEEEGEKISAPEGLQVVDTANLTGTHVSGATGTIAYRVYHDPECKELAAEAGDFSVEGGVAPPSEGQELKADTYYWQASYSGDALHQAATSACTEVATVLSATSIVTSLAGEGKESEEGESPESTVITVTEGAAVTDTATLSGTRAAEATGTIEYLVYSDPSCEELVAHAGEVTVKGATAPPSSAETLEPGIYFWRAVYSGDASNYGSAAGCGSEVEVVAAPITTTLSAAGESAETIEAVEGTPVSDAATLHGVHASEATGTVTYKVYEDDECKEPAANAGEVSVAGANVPPSSGVELPAGTYYWQAEYSGDGKNPAAVSACGAEVESVVTATSLTTSLSGGGEEANEIEVEEGTAVSDQATLSGVNAATAGGEITYSVYKDSSCTELRELAGDAEVAGGVVPASEKVTLPAGTYYWQAEYSGDGINQKVKGSCGSEVEVVSWPITLILSGGEQTGSEVETLTGAPVVGEATLHGEHASEATGTVTYKVYGDAECSDLVANAGEVAVSGASVPVSSEEELESGTYYWRAEYSGDSMNPPSTSGCGRVRQVVFNPLKDRYAALGDSYSSGVGVMQRVEKNPPGAYYAATKWRLFLAPFFVAYRPFVNACFRSEAAWPALVATAIYGAGVAAENKVLEQKPAQFIFRACSGAVTTNIKSAANPPGLESGQFDEPTPNPLRWVGPKPAQYLWLGEPAGVPKNGAKPDKTIKLVTLTIGGNDASFAAVATACLKRPGQLGYSPDECIARIKAAEATFNAIKGNLKTVLSAIRELAPNARILLPMYPQVVNQGMANIPVGAGVTIDNAVRGKEKITAAQGVVRFIRRLDEKLDAAAKEWVVETGGAAELLGRTYWALFNHMRGDAKPWINGIVFPFVESFHPNVCGQRAIALRVLPMVRGGVGPVPVEC